MTNMTKMCRCLVQFEDDAAALYLTLARRFARNKELSWFWLEMSMEEKQHAVLMEFCGCEDLLGRRMPDRAEIERLALIVASLKRKAARRDLSLDGAFLIAAELESSEINNIFTRLITPVRGTPYILRKKIETLGSNHMQDLIRGARKFGVSGETLTKMNQAAHATPGRRMKRAV